MAETRSLDPENVRVGVIIRTLRESRGLTSDELGEAIGVTGGQVRHIERGLRRASLANCVAIARELDAPLATIVGEETAAIIEAQPDRAAS